MELTIVDTSRTMTMANDRHSCAGATPADPVDPLLLRALESGALSEDRFDGLLPFDLRGAQSFRHWTPLAVARLTVRTFEQHGVARVLDVGSGAGKFCIAAGACARSVQLTGVERRPRLVDVARRLAKRCGLSNVRFVLGDAFATPWSDFDGLYVFNPFGESLFAPEDRLDDAYESSERGYLADVVQAERALRSVRRGTVLVTYRGLGGGIPRSFDLERTERVDTTWLRVWIKRRDDGEGGGTHWCELADGRIVETTVDELIGASGVRIDT